MTSLNVDGRVGAQLPTSFRLPKVVASSAGSEAIDLAASVGLILDPWQQWVLNGALSERQDGRWSAFECALIVPRQNGKNTILEALELAGLFLFDEELIIHSAHRFDTCQEHFIRLRQLIEESPDLDRKVDKIITANGKEAINLTNGHRIKFVARARGSGRGFSGSRIVLDEAFDLPARSVGAMIPAMSAKSLSGNVQIWYTSSAPHATSAILHELRRRGLAGDEDRLFYAEWGNSDAGTELLDVDAWYRANPGLGIRISEEFVRDELRAMAAIPGEFRRERLGIPDLEAADERVWAPEVWRAVVDELAVPTGSLSLSADATPDWSFSSLAVVGGGVAEVVDHRSGTDWVVPRVVELRARNLDIVGPVAIDPAGPLGMKIPAFEAAGVDVLKVQGQEMVRACAGFYTAVSDRLIRVRFSQAVEDAVTGARTSPAGDGGWKWSRRDATVDVSPLVAVTLAWWAAAQVGEPVFAGGFADLDDY